MQAPPLHGEDKEEIAEIEGVSADAYTSVVQQRATDRSAKRREQAEDRREDHKPKFIQPQKECLFVPLLGDAIACGRKGPPAWIKSRLPKHGGFEDGASLSIKKMFVNFYNRVREMLSIHSVHLRSETGIAIPDEAHSLQDSIAGYVGYGGLIYVVDGPRTEGKPWAAFGFHLAALSCILRRSSPGKLPENVVYFWGSNSWSDTPSPVLTLQRKRISQAGERQLAPISVGKEHAVALTEGGRVFAWGKNDFGQLGTGDEEYTELPYETYISQIAAGGNYTIGVTKRGDVWSWGRFQASSC
eukprot:Skav200981  [mRNA]  locus=scaffold1596:79285:82233:- [translate_table: standard]